MAGVFLQWRARKATTTLGQNWRSCSGSALRTVEAKEKQVEQMSASGRRWPSSGARTHDVEALAKHTRHAAISSCAGRPRRALTVF